MVFISRFHKKCRIASLEVAIVAIILAALFCPTIEPVKSVGNNIFTLFVNGKEMGTVDSEADAEEILTEARRKISNESVSADRLALIEADYEVVGDEIIRGITDDRESVLENVVKEYEASVKETIEHSYTVKIDEYKVSVSSADNVVSLLEACLRKYDPDGKFYVELTRDSSRELPVLVPVIKRTEDETEETVPVSSDYLGNDGLFKAFDEIFDSIHLEEEPDFDDYEYGLTDISFYNSVEVVEAYLPASQLTLLSTAIEDVTKNKEQKTTYEVQSGDTLSKISNKTGVSVDDLISLNSDSLTDEKSVIRIGQDLVITVPTPELSINHEELVYYEGTYEADVIYIYNDSWYTTTEEILQDPSSGYHKAVEKITYLNNEVVSTEVVMEEVVVEAVPKIVEKGTKIPPTYIKPISGGRITSGFGTRTATIKGMTSYHGAIDWGTPVGTTVVASCGGTVTQAGWMSGYGYVVFINHPDGKQTRYAHLSKIYVSVGQSVVQGQKIAASGNTGVSTGPHLHFEMRINGKMVNPLNYLSY